MSLLFTTLQEITIFKGFCFFLNPVGERAIDSSPYPPPQWGRGNVFQTPICNIKRFPFQFFQFNFLLASCFLFLYFEASPNSSFDIKFWSRQKRDKEICRRKGIRDCSLLSFVFSNQIKSFLWHQVNIHALIK